MGRQAMIRALRGMGSRRPSDTQLAELHMTAAEWDREAAKDRRDQERYKGSRLERDNRARGQR